MQTLILDESGWKYRPYGLPDSKNNFSDFLYVCEKYYTVLHFIYVFKILLKRGFNGSLLLGFWLMQFCVFGVSTDLNTYYCSKISGQSAD